MVFPVVLFWHNVPIQITRIGIVHLCFVDSLVAVLDQVVDLHQVALCCVVPKPIGHVSLGLDGLDSVFAGL